MTSITLDTVWAYAQRLSATDRLTLSNRIRESINETEETRKKRAEDSINAFFGGWNEDPRSTDEIYSDIRANRTINLWSRVNSSMDVWKLY